jgi:hypothetical protein
VSIDAHRRAITDSNQKLSEAPVAPALPMIEEDLTEAITASGTVRATPRE